MKRLPIVTAALALLALATPSQALDILICNDDGFTSANSRALFRQLEEAGHRVVMAAPVDNQSGRGGYISFLAPVPPIAATYVDPYTGRAVTPRAVRSTYPSLIGAPGIGTDSVDSRIAYVNGSPVMACLYGIDVKAPATFGHVPELVISGPNEGNNLGQINASSGTVNIVYYAINRRIPAMAVSDAVSTSVEFTALTPTSRSHEVASIVTRLVTELVARQPDADDHHDEADEHHDEDQRRPRGVATLLPPAVGLNVNIPAFAPGTGSALRFAVTHMGTATTFVPAFYADLGLNAFAASAGIPAGLGLSGIGLVASGATLPTGVVVPADNSRTSEGNVIANGGRVSVSVIAGVPEAAGDLVSQLKRRLLGDRH